MRYLRCCHNNDCAASEETVIKTFVFSETLHEGAAFVVHSECDDLHCRNDQEDHTIHKVGFEIIIRGWARTRMNRMLGK